MNSEFRIKTFSSHALNCFVPYLTLFLRHIFPHYFQHQRALLTIGLLHKIYCLMVGMHNLKINNIKLLNCLDKNFHYQNDLSWKTLTLSSTTLHFEQNCLLSQDISRRDISPTKNLEKMYKKRSHFLPRDFF